MTGHHVLTDADLEPIDPARLQAAIAAVCAMSNADFVAACAAVDRQVHLDPQGFADFLDGRLR